MKAIKKYSRGGISPHKPLTEEEKRKVELLFDGDVEAYLRSKEMTRVIEDYQHNQQMRNLSQTGGDVNISNIKTPGK